MAVPTPRRNIRAAGCIDGPCCSVETIGLFPIQVLIEPVRCIGDYHNKSLPGSEVLSFVRTVWFDDLECEEVLWKCLFSSVNDILRIGQSPNAGPPYDGVMTRGSMGHLHG